MRNCFRVLCVGCALLIATAVPSARAAFVNGVERFDGTSLDLSTWERYQPSVTNYSQNDALTISGAGNFSDYTTRAVSVSVGQRATAEVSLVLPQNEPTANFSAGLLVTDDSTGTATEWVRDSRYFGCLITVNTATGVRAFQAVDGGNGFYGSAYFAGGSVQPGVTYVLSIQRDSPQQYVLSASQTDGTPIFSQKYTPDPDQQDLHIALVRINQRFAFDCTATYDNVTITSVPEPALMAAACVAFSALGRARRRRPLTPRGGGGAGRVRAIGPAERAAVDSSEPAATLSPQRLPRNRSDAIAPRPSRRLRCKGARRTR